MRTHTRYRAFDLRHDRGLLQSIVAPETLVAARLEPAMSMRHEAALDISFSRDGLFAGIGFVVVEGVMLLERERDPIVWPRWVGDMLGERTLDAVADRLYPWLRSRVLARCENDEIVRMFSDDAAVVGDYERARGEGLIGAAPLLTVCRSLASAVYAQRFVHGQCVGVFDRAGANAAALLSGRARAVGLDLGDANLLKFAQRWFATLDIGEVPAGSAYDVELSAKTRHTAAPIRIIAGGEDRAGSTRVSVARPIPLSMLVSFDVEDSILDATLSVELAHAALPRHSTMPPVVPIGGSTGRIALLVRDDYVRIPDADTDAIRVLAARLADEGFAVRIVEASKTLRPSDVDLVHVVGHRHAAAILPTIQAMRRHSVPVVIMPYLDDPLGQAAWGINSTVVTLRIGSDDALAEMYATALAARKLIAEVPFPATPPPIDESVRALLLEANAAIVVSPDEEQYLRERVAFAAPCSVVPALFDMLEPCAVDALVGAAPFVLVHAPFDPSGGMLGILLAAQREGLPIVLTGPVANGEYYAQIMAALDDRGIYLPEHDLTPEVLAGLYGRARVYAEASWAGAGLHRLARAAACGAALVASAAGLAASVWGESVELGDPASVSSIAGALRRAWDAAPVRTHTLTARTAQLCDQATALRDVASAYQAASAQAVP